MSSTYISITLYSVVHMTYSLDSSDNCTELVHNDLAHCPVGVDTYS